MYRQVTIELKPGDATVFYTDGITEAMNAQHQEWGVERLKGLARAQGGNSAQGLVNAVADSLKDFAGDEPQGDDMTMVVARRRPAVPSGLPPVADR